MNEQPVVDPTDVLHVPTLGRRKRPLPQHPLKATFPFGSPPLNELTPSIWIEAPVTHLHSHHPTLGQPNLQSSCWSCVEPPMRINYHFRKHKRECMDYSCNLGSVLSSNQSLGQQTSDNVPRPAATIDQLHLNQVLHLAVACGTVNAGVLRCGRQKPIGTGSP